MNLWRLSPVGLAVFTAAALLFAAPPGAPAAARDLTRTVYDFAVTSYCGTLTPEVEAGFHKELAALTQRRGLDPESARRQRIQGWIQAEREWRNRGLGGQRAWCLEEGVPAARRFREIARGERRP